MTIWCQFSLVHRLSFQHVNASLLSFQESVLELYPKHLFWLIALVFFFGDTNYAYIGFFGLSFSSFAGIFCIICSVFLSYPPSNLSFISGGKKKLWEGLLCHSWILPVLISLLPWILACLMFLSFFIPACAKVLNFMMGYLVIIFM